ncbi:hypothetical protein EYC84_009638 [Monilinia fructicola]|uniref:Uncharacterized protein n=1 Tax=Monilinia fructicola TaxID=38448 RepID=A0A5M9JF66_MONFR|nr:hypothetical protein EYC84_009638 [Monilinia fructicola]
MHPDLAPRTAHPASLQIANPITKRKVQSANCHFPRPHTSTTKTRARRDEKQNRNVNKSKSLESNASTQTYIHSNRLSLPLTRRGSTAASPAVRMHRGVGPPYQTRKGVLPIADIRKPRIVCWKQGRKLIGNPVSCLVRRVRAPRGAKRPRVLGLGGLGLGLGIGVTAGLVDGGWDGCSISGCGWW